MRASKLPFAGPTMDFVTSEILRVGAPLAEVQSAITLIRKGSGLDPRVYDALSPRMRRLVDLIDVVGGPLAASLFEMPEASPQDA